MNKIQPIVTFRTGVAGAKFVICLSGAMDAFDSMEPYSRIYFLNERALSTWTFNEHDFVVPSVCVWRDPVTPDHGIFVGVSENGQVVYLRPQQIVEQIPDAGLYHDSSKGFGYLNDIQQIGSTLYACGYSGQVYKRRGDNDWVHMDQEILQQPGTNGGEYFAQAINGPNEHAIYLAGSVNLPGHPPRADFWNGSQWKRLILPMSAGRITNIFVESEDRIWMCGAKGTLLLGNARDGFVAMNPLGARQLLLSVTKFKNLYYLGTNIGLFEFDPNKQIRVFRKVRTQLQPEIADTNIVQSVDDVLWCMGAKDIVRFDGVKWERFHHPDNPPISGIPIGSTP
jgi:hypothetical protein